MLRFLSGMLTMLLIMSVASAVAVTQLGPSIGWNEEKFEDQSANFLTRVDLPKGINQIKVRPTIVKWSGGKNRHAVVMYRVSYCYKGGLCDMGEAPRPDYAP